jgi:hypothetical protein
MSSLRARPSGVTVLVVLEIIVGLILLGGGLLFGILSALVAGVGASELGEFSGPLAAISGIIGGIFVVAGLLSFVEAFGLWRGSGCAWILGLILAALGIILGISSLPTGIIYIAIQAVIIYYLTRPYVRQYFGQTVSAPSPPPSPPPSLPASPPA